MRRRALILSCGCCLFFVATGRPAGAANNCTNERATLEMLHMQEINFVDPSCASLPSVTVNWDYRCTRCQQPSPPDRSLTGTGLGGCEGPYSCAPKYLGEFPDGSNKMIMKIQNRTMSSGVCHDTTISVNTALCFCPSPHTCDQTPIVISIHDREVDMTSAECGVDFDLNVDGTSESLSWTAPGSDEAFLFLDRNENGVVDNGAELFGNYTPQSPVHGERNGFNALKMFDEPLNGGNEDGLITPSDRIYRHLGLWMDDNHNGFSESEELYTVGQLGIEGIDLDYQKSSKSDRYGNEFRYWSIAYLAGDYSKPRRDRSATGSSREAWDVYLVLGTSEETRVFEEDCLR